MSFPLIRAACRWYWHLTQRAPYPHGITDDFGVVVPINLRQTAFCLWSLS